MELDEEYGLEDHPMREKGLPAWVTGIRKVSDQDPCFGQRASDVVS